jgi:hypothetical protein
VVEKLALFFQVEIIPINIMMEALCADPLFNASIERRILQHNAKHGDRIPLMIF